MKILVRGDLHLDLVSDGEPRLEEQRRILNHTVHLLRIHEPDLFVDLGDLFDRPRPSPAAYEVALAYAYELGEWQRRVHPESTNDHAVILAGNHDKPSRGSISALQPLQALYRTAEWRTFVRPILKPELVGFGDWGIVYLSYVTDWEAKNGNCSQFESAQALVDDFAKTVVDSEFERLLCFTHLEVPGARLADDERVQRDVGLRIPDFLLESEKVIRIYAGHVHKYQELDRVTVVGSAIHVDFGEATDPKGILLAEFA